MTILCGTDFSDDATQAAQAAALIAARMQIPLCVVHAVDLSDRVADASVRAQLRKLAAVKLDDEAAALRKLGAEVSTRIDDGSADDVVLRAATDVSATLVVVAALGSRKRGTFQLGSHADRLAQRSHAPVLVVRDPERIMAWARCERPLRVVLGADFTASSEVAMRWVHELRRVGPCEITAAHMYWPPEQFQRLGLAGLRSYVEPAPEVTQTIERDLRAHLTRHAQIISKLRIEPHLGRIGDRLSTIAGEEDADLVVVGSHDRGAARVWEGSVSRIVLQQAQTSVACVPAPRDVHVTELPRLQTVLVVTDFSPTGNAAIPLAYAAAERGAKVHVAHVVPDPIRGETAPRDIFAPVPSTGPYHDVQAQLTHLIPKSASQRGQTTEIHVLQSDKAAEAICQAGERLGADFICLGTHGRSGLAKVVLGSVAQAVLANTARPVLLARKPKA